jgi:SAM-dependent methyltransferase
MDEFKYVGSELDLFSAVHNWKSYWSSRIKSFIVGDVLEVGAGIGSNTSYLDQKLSGRWVCLEPDSNLISLIHENLARVRHRKYEVVCGTLKKVDAERFDTIIYIDVLEHIENDVVELETASKLLRAGGRLIVLSPAHKFLFTPFDAAIGHYRRYNTSTLRSLTPLGLDLERIFYLDSVGMALSFANRLILKQSMPTKEQLRFWDQCVIPISRVTDRFLFGSLGKTIVAIWVNKQNLLLQR